MFRAVVPSVGLVLKARGDIRGKQEAYARRIREDFPEGGDEFVPVRVKPAVIIVRMCIEDHVISQLSDDADNLLQQIAV